MDAGFSQSGVFDKEGVTYYPIGYRLIGRPEGDVKGGVAVSVNKNKGIIAATYLVESEESSYVKTLVLSTREYRNLLSFPLE